MKKFNIWKFLIVCIVVFGNNKVTSTQNSNEEEKDICLPTNICGRLKIMEESFAEFRRRVKCLEQAGI